MRLTHSRLEEDFLMLAELDDGVDLLLAVWLRVIGLWKEKAKEVMHLINTEQNQHSQNQRVYLGHTNSITRPPLLLAQSKMKPCD